MSMILSFVLVLVQLGYILAKALDSHKSEELP